MGGSGLFRKSHTYTARNVPSTAATKIARKPANFAEAVKQSGSGGKASMKRLIMRILAYSARHALSAQRCKNDRECVYLIIDLTEAS